MSQPQGVAAKVFHNSFWVGIETVTEVIVMTGTSIAVARVLGPEKMGQYTSIFYPIAVLQTLGGTALSVATRKFMMERLAVGQVGLARSVYQYNLAVQLRIGLAISAALALLIYFFAPPPSRPMGWILAASTIPSFFSFVGAQANVAHEDASRNVFSGLTYVFCNALLIVMSLVYGWGLTGIAVAWTVSHTLEAVLRIVPLHLQFRSVPLHDLNDAEKASIRRFAVQALGIQILTTVVWNRSELLLLAWLSTAKQVAFYGVSSSFSDRLLLAPSMLGSGLGISMMAESVRARARIERLVAAAVRFLSFVTLPICLGAAAIAGPLISLLYGHRYDPAIPVMEIAAVLGIFRAYICVPDALLRAGDRQMSLIWCMIIAGIVNMGADVPLILKYGAVGAAIGNGIGQGIGVSLIWIVAARYFSLRISWNAQARFLATALVPAIAGFVLTDILPPVIGIAAAIVALIVLYFLCLRLFRPFEFEDSPRLRFLADRFPARFRGIAWKLLKLGVKTPQNTGPAEVFPSAIG